MIVDFLLVLHIAVLGYWLGAELVINSEYRLVCFASSMPFSVRERLMEHVMEVDQHVRYALVLQASLGVILAALLGYVRGGTSLAWAAGIIGLGWLAYVELVHRLRHTSMGSRLALVDRVIRYALLILLLALGGATAAGLLDLQIWLGWKLVLFGGVIACGVGIRISLIAFFGLWHEIRAHGSNEVRERAVRRMYIAGTSILGILWILIAMMVGLSVFKPS